MEKFEKAEQLRNKALKWMHNQPGPVSANDLAAYMAISNDHAHRTLRKMLVNGEVKRLSVGRASGWIPLAVKTVSAEEMKAKAYHKASKTREHGKNIAEGRGKSTNNEYVDGRLVHVVCWDAPVVMPNQGGQGGGYRPFMSSCMA